MSNIQLGKRIMIIGSCGSGKTTLALQLSNIISIPVIHLDKEFWQAGWVATPENKWQEKLHKLVSKESWIIDGNYGGDIDLNIRLEKADTVIFLDFSRYLCTFRVLKRWLTNIGGTRIDMGDGCKEKIDLAFLKFVWQFPIKSRMKLLSKVNEYSKVKLIKLRNPKETKQFLCNL